VRSELASETHIGGSEVPAFGPKLRCAGPSWIEDDRKFQADNLHPDPEKALLADRGCRSHGDGINTRHPLADRSAHIEPAVRKPSLREECFGDDAVFDRMVIRDLMAIV
jgi:hypothetical protein